MRSVLSILFLVAFAGSSVWGQPSSGPIEIGEVDAQPGERVRVALYATYDAPLRSFAVFFHFDAAQLAYESFDISNGVATAFGPLDTIYRTFDPPGDAIAGIINNSTNQDLEFRRVPPGERQHLGDLVFRVHASAATGDAFVRIVEAVEASGGSTSFHLDDGDDRDGVVDYPFSFIHGRVRVVAPEGPRPVADLACSQFLDRAIVTFAPTESYDEIEVLRDGEAISVLPGSATEFAETLPGGGTLVYGVVARRGGEESIAVDCELVPSPPVAPSVTDLDCEEGRISWENPFMFDAITIFRDSQPIATIAGDRESFTDDSRSGQRALYTVITELGGFRSPEVHCLDPAVWITEIGDVQVPVDAELVRVPVYLTTSEPSRGWDAFLEVPNDRLAIVRSLGPIFADTVWIHDPEFVGVGVSGATGFPAAGVLYDNLPPNQPEKDLPAGLRQYVLNFVFRPLGEFADGEVIDVKLLTASFSVRTESTTVSIAPDVLIPGQIRFGTAGPAPVEELAAAVPDGAGAGGDGGEGGVVLAWRNADDYEMLRVERNGEPIAEIDGSATRFHDVTAPGGVFTYKVSGSRDGQSSFPASAFVSTIMPRGAFLRGDANRDRRVNLSDAVATLNYLFLGSARLPCDDAADADDDGALRITDPILTLNYLFLGSGVMKAPGTRYAWFDPSADNLTCRE